MVADPSSICGWNPDMYGVRNTEAGQSYYDSLIEMYASRGVDFIKCDDICDSFIYRNDSFSGWHESEMLYKAIQKSNREIVLSLSPGPAHIDRAWQYCRYANMWRITDDFWDNWELLKNMFWRCELWQDHVKEGCFPDCDMLPLGKVGKGFETGERLSVYQGRAEDHDDTMVHVPFSADDWCELTKMDDFTLSLLTNKELLVLPSEDFRGEQLRRSDGEADWKNTSTKTGMITAALFNLSDTDREICSNMEELSGREPDKDSYEFTELWSGEVLHSGKEALTVVVPAHGTKVFSVR